MTQTKLNLNSIQIAKPCPMSWDKMNGDDRTRHCSECKMNVYNISGLTKHEAESLLKRAAGGERVCMRIFKRADGTVITKDCPVGVRAWRFTQAKVSALVGFLIGLGIWASGEKAESRSQRLMGEVAVSPKKEPEANKPLLGRPYLQNTTISAPAMGTPAAPEPLMGDVYIPSPTPTPELEDMVPKK